MKSAVIAALVAALLSLPALADDKHHNQAKATSETAALADGEIRKVDKDAKKITIKHGPIDKLDMGPHTMVFQVTDAAMLERVKPGDKVKFDAEKVGGAFRLTKLEPAK